VHTWIFSHQQIASVACSQNVSESVYTACIAFCENDGTTQAAVLHQILPEAWQQPRENHSEDSVGFGDDGMGITQIKEWENQFKDGRTSVESDAHFVRPSTTRNDELIDQVRTLVMQDHRVTVRELAEEVGISTGSVHSFLTDDSALRRVSAKFVPKLLTME